MVLTNCYRPRPRNRLLAALPPDVLAELWPRLEAIQLPRREILYAPGEPITAALFVETGTVSLIARLSSGDVIETGMIGYEGMVGLPILLGDSSDEFEATVQVPGTALQIGVEVLQEALKNIPAFRSLLLRYALFQHRQTAWTAACNGRHCADQRLASRLLAAHDRAEGDTLPVTHESLSTLLGLRRSGITVTAQRFKAAGLIRCTRGCIEITDRAGLEATACECYGVARQSLHHLLGSEGGAKAFPPSQAALASRRKVPSEPAT